MSVDMYVSASQAQADSVSSMTQKQIQGYEQLKNAINEFTLNSPFLTGQAYDSAKAYFAQVLYPLAQGGILLSEAVAEAVRNFPEAYISDVDSGDLKQCELEEKIRQVNNLIAQAEEISRELYDYSTPDATKSAQLSSNRLMLGMYEALKGNLEEKLRKLMLFNVTSPSLFADIETLEAAVNQGLAQTKTAFSSKSGSFSVPSQADLTWQKTIVDKWTEFDNKKQGTDA